MVCLRYDESGLLEPTLVGLSCVGLALGLALGLGEWGCVTLVLALNQFRRVWPIGVGLSVDAIELGCCEFRWMGLFELGRVEFSGAWLAVAGLCGVSSVQLMRGVLSCVGSRRNELG